MYIPPAFRIDELSAMHDLIASARLAQFITATAEGLVATPLPMLLVPDEGPHGTLYGHLARANPQGNLPAIGEALAIFTGADAYVSPGWYAAKKEHGKVVPTWNYIAVHAYGQPEFFDDGERLLDIVTRLTARHEQGRPAPWSPGDAPENFIRAQLRQIVGLRLPVARIEGKCKMSQNRSLEDRRGVAEGLAASSDATDREVAGLIPVREVT